MKFRVKLVSQHVKQPWGTLELETDFSKIWGLSSGIQSMLNITVGRLLGQFAEIITAGIDSDVDFVERRTKVCYTTIIENCLSELKKKICKKKKNVNSNS